MARTLLTSHGDALAAFKSLCAERRFNRALNLLADGGTLLPYSHPPGEPESGAFCLTPSACDGDGDLEAFRAWMRGQSEAADFPPQRSLSDGTDGACQCDFDASGHATRDFYPGGMP